MLDRQVVHTRWKKRYEFELGSYVFSRGREEEGFTVNLAPRQVVKYADRNVDWPDFGCPRDTKEIEDILFEIAKRVKSNKPVYFGCYGGMGRTGTLAALLLKVLGSKNPIRDIRMMYSDHAVETAKQEQYVTEFDVRPVRIRLFWWKVRNFFRLS